MLINRNLSLLRILFITPWLFVLLQVALVNDSQHRFSALGQANIMMAISYLICSSFIFLLMRKAKTVPLGFILAVVLFLTILIVSFFLNDFRFLVKDAGLILLQFMFFALGWFFYSEIQNSGFVKTILLDNLLIGAVGAVIIRNYGFDVVSPLFGYLALATFAYARFGKQYRNVFILALLIFNLGWSFGKQTLLLSLLCILIGGYQNNELQRKRVVRLLKILSKTLLLGLFVFVIVSFSDVLNLRSLVKFEILFQKLDLSQILFGLGKADALYLSLDVSTAGRVLELVLIWENLVASPLNFMFGSGLGASLDLGIKNAYAGLSYNFEETQSVQTLLAFVPSRFGFLGVAAVIFIFFRSFNKRHLSGSLFAPWLICFFLSLMAFPTVFRFHFFGFFWGAMVHSYLQKKKNGAD